MKAHSNVGISYKAFDKRVEAVKAQNGSIIHNFSGDRNVDVKKVLPSHLIPNDLILRMDKQKYYGEEKNININSINTNNDLSIAGSSTQINSNPIQHKIEKYKDFFFILKEDLKRNLDKNVQIAREIQEIEEERSYYLEKIKEVYVN